jgi:uncharacterized protein YkwD
MFRKRFFATVGAMLAGATMLHVDPSTASRKSSRSGGCARAATVPVNDGMRRHAAHAVLCLVNRLRASHGLRLVRRSSQLSVAARRHSADMVQRKYFSHVGIGGDTLGARVSSTGYVHSHRDCQLSEAIAWETDASPKTLVRALMHSPPHRRILLDRHAHDIGIGLSLGAPINGIRTSSATLVLALGG